ncbi:UDP-2,3-diacylglucosamine diphosphatase [Candidatus Vondammii sp. HM_W22]|uniref:UDP-2,3-diacylglucosamine diphosphatase n=1 Tax=Candidatus Vondammii sp. HM_W22 TaxID=2687299 RepID=UPI001F13549E|nr:UDP-2,3-diacylglucosamine diphosphatase [Candidatus Vondammii sp. HM_W22]
MTDSLFISDLHLSQKCPGTTDLFLRFLEEQVDAGVHLYILGDLFDTWVGDDDTTPAIKKATHALLQATIRGAQLSIMHGNRDFLIGEAFAKTTGCTLLDDPTVVDLNGLPTLLMHGDLLCSDDLEYQQARELLRSHAFISDFLAKPIQQRKILATEYRKKSGEVVSLKSADIMDVNQYTVETYMRNSGVKLLIHGHTHRPAIHDFKLDGQSAERIVLSDWHEKRGEYLRVSGTEITRHMVSGASVLKKIYK